MKNIFLLAYLIFPILIFSQLTGSISGTITDVEMDGEPFLYAQVELRDTPWKTRTNLNGNFEMEEIASGAYTLAISFPGYETLEILVEVGENEAVEIRKELSANSVDVDSILASDLQTKAHRDALADSRRKQKIPKELMTREF